MESKTRGWVNIIGALVAGWLAWTGQDKWSLLILALLFLIAGWHHTSRGK